MDGAGRTDHEQPHDEVRGDAWWRSRVDRPHASASGERAAIRAAWPLVARLIEERLTPRQREIVELHFFRGFDQPAVAQLLGISQQAVSEHLHGKRRGDARIGGIIPKLRKLCARHGLDVAR